jgi:protein-disulfide isomerase
MSFRYARTLALLTLALAGCAKPEDDDAAAAAHAPPPFDLNRIDQSRQLGSPTAKVWFIMGSDFQCPYCKAFHDETWGRINEEYVKTGKVRAAFLHHPMDFHPRAIPAAEAAMCAGAQDRFWVMHDSLFANQEKWVGAPDPQPIFESLAKSIGLEVDAWRNCVTSHATRTQVEADYLRTKQVGIKGTPSFVIGDSLAIVGAAPFADFKKAIDAALARAK